MKTIYINIILGFLILLMASCYKDKSNTTISELNKVSIEGIENEYKVIAIRDVLKINPIINSKEDKEFEYFWAYYGFDSHGTITSKFDTINHEKNLEFPMNIAPGNYQFVFSVKDTETGISVFKFADISVETVTSRGWYILKDKAGYTDLDLFTEEGVLTNIISKANNGRSLLGNARQIGFTGKYNYVNPETKKLTRNVRCIVPMSDSDMSMLRISDSKELNSFEGMFYVVSEECKPNFWTTSTSGMYYTNKGKSYSIYGMSLNTGKFAGVKIADYDYSLSNFFISSYPFLKGPTVFDEVQSTFYALDMGSTLIPYLDDGRDNSLKYYPTKNLNADLLYMDYQEGGHKSIGTGIALLRKRDNSDILLAQLEMFSNYWGGGYKNPIFEMDTISSDRPIASADKYAMNKNFDLLYYTKANTISYYNIITKEEKVIYTLDTGEEITYIHHSKYNEGNAQYDFDKLVVASYSGGNYKIYLFDMLAGKPKDNPVIMEGEGRVGHAIYISPKLNEFTIKY
jgi:hypothetical protein